MQSFFQRWLRSVQASLEGRSSRARGARPVRRRETTLSVESLEDRAVMAVAVVDQGENLSISTDTSDNLTMSATGNVLTLSSNTGLVNGNAAVNGISTATFNLADFSSITVNTNSNPNLVFSNVNIVGSADFANESLLIFGVSVSLSGGPLSANGVTLIGQGAGIAQFIDQQINSTGDVTITPLGGGVFVDAPIYAPGRNVTLIAGTILPIFTVSQSAAGVITADSLFVQGQNVDLSTAANQVSNLAGLTLNGPGDFRFNSALDLNVTTVSGVNGVTTFNGNVALSVAAGKSITTNQPITANGAGRTLTLAADDFILSPGAPLTAENIVFTTVGNGVNLVLGTDLTESELNAINAASNLTIQASGAISMSTSINLSDDVTKVVTLKAGAVDVSQQLFANGATGVLRFETNSLNLNTALPQLILATQVEIVATQDISFTAAAGAGGLDFSQADLNSFSEAFLNTLRFSTTGNITFANGAMSFDNGAVLAAGGVLALKADKTISQVAKATISAPRLAAIGGFVALTESGNNIQIVAGSAATGDFALRTAAGLQIDVLDVGERGIGTSGITVSAPAARADLQTGGNLTQTASGKITAPALAARAAGVIDLGSTVANSVSTLALRGGSSGASYFRNDSGGTLTIGAVGALSGITFDGGGASFELLTADGLEVAQAIQVAGGGRINTLILASSDGAVSQTASGKLEAGFLVAVSETNITLDGASNNVDTIAMRADGLGAIKFKNDAGVLRISNGVGAFAGAAGVTSGDAGSTVELSNTGNLELWGNGVGLQGGGRIAQALLTSVNGNVTQNLGTVEAASLGVYAGGAIALSTLTNNVSTLALRADGGASSFKNDSGGVLTIGAVGSLSGITSTSASATTNVVTADGLTIAGNIQTTTGGALNSVSLTASEGTLQQNAGTLINGTGVALAAGADVTIGGRLEVGLSDATVSAGSAFTLASGGTIGLTVASPSNLSNVNVTAGSVNVAGGTIALNFLDAAGTAPSLPDQTTTLITTNRLIAGVPTTNFYANGTFSGTVPATGAPTIVNLAGNPLLVDVLVGSNIAFTVAAPTPIDADGASGGSIPEGVATAGTTVGITASVPDYAGQGVTYSLTSNPGNLFAIDPTTGVVTVAATTTFDLDTTPSYTIEITATVGGISDSQSFTIAVTNVAPGAPSDADVAANSVVEGAIAGTPVGYTATATDAGGGTVTYVLTNDAGGRFQINATTGVVTVANAALIDFESNPSQTYTISVAARDAQNLQGAAVDVVIAVTNAAPAAPSDSDAAANAVLEGAAGGALVGVVASAADPNGGTVTYSLTDTAGGRFQINATTGVVSVATGAVIDYESSGGSYSIVVVASDGLASSTASTFVIQVTNVPPSAPVDSDATVNTIIIGSPAGTAVGIVASSSDVNGGAVTYSLSNDAGGRFTIDPTTGVVRLAAGATLAPRTNYTISVRASDGTDFSTATDFTILAVYPTVIVNGTESSDAIKVGYKDGVYIVKVNGVFWEQTYVNVDHFEIYGFSGGDFIEADDTALAPFYIDGGSGNDTIIGGAGDDVLVGGLGNDTIDGYLGRDVIIGGLGKDSLKGSESGLTADNASILIGDSTDYDGNLTALFAISEAWAANNASTEATVRTYFKSTTVHGDDQADVIKSNSAIIDWIFSYQLKSSGSPFDSLRVQSNDTIN